MSKCLSIDEAQAALPECIRQIQKGEPLLIMRGEKPVAALIRPEDLAQLERLAETHAEAGLASLAGGWDGSDDLVRCLETSSRIGQRDIAVIDE